MDFIITDLAGLAQIQASRLKVAKIALENIADVRKYHDDYECPGESVACVTCRNLDAQREYYAAEYRQLNFDR